MRDPVIGAARAAASPSKKFRHKPVSGRDIDSLPDSMMLSSREAASFLRMSLPSLNTRCGDDPNDPFRPLHPIRMGGVRLFSVANVRQVLKHGIPRRPFNLNLEPANVARKRNAARRRAAKARQEVEP